MDRLKSFIYKIGYPLAKMYWYVRRPTTTGVRCFVLHQNKLLLVRHTYGSHSLTIPGGGVKKNETLEQAVTREIHEETGLKITNIIPAGTMLYKGEFKNDTIHIFVANSNESTLRIDGSEIERANWYSINQLPEGTSMLFGEFFTIAAPEILKTQAIQ